MKLEDQVCSLEYAKKLRNLEWEKESIFYWHWYKKNRDYERIECDLMTSKIADFDDGKWKFICYPAFTVAELGEMLPDCVNASKLFNNKNTTLMDLNGHFIKSSKKDDEYKIYIDGLTKVTIFFSKNEANARAKMLIYLLENGLIEIKT